MIYNFTILVDRIAVCVSCVLSAQKELHSDSFDKNNELLMDEDDQQMQASTFFLLHALTPGAFPNNNLKLPFPSVLRGVKLHRCMKLNKPTRALSPHLSGRSKKVDGRPTNAS